MINLIEKKYFTNIDQFEFRLSNEKKLIGTGSFGVVKLALHKGTNRVYAIKIMDLASLEDPAEFKIIEREIQIHGSLDHPHIVKLWNTLIHDDKVYMIMEYAENGNLFYYQNTKIRFSEPEAFKFFFQSAKAIDYLHQNDIIHRDLKPENMLLDDAYNIKLCDFGWSAYDINAKRSTFCGTYEYMAPEMLIDKSYDYKIDIWGLGILLYELLHGKAPFRGQNVQDIKKSMNSSFSFKESLSDSVKDLIRKMLQINPVDRISLAELFKHEWVIKMSDLINNALRKCQTTYPNCLNNRIAQINFSKQKKKKHQKTESASHISLPKEKSININFLINNYSMLKKAEETRAELLQNSPQKQKPMISHKSTKSYQRFKTLTEQSEFDMLSPSKIEGMKKIKARCNIKPEFEQIDRNFRKIIRRKSQENIKEGWKPDSALRIVTEAQESKPFSKKRKLPEESQKKKMSSPGNPKRTPDRLF